MPYTALLDDIAGVVVCVRLMVTLQTVKSLMCWSVVFMGEAALGALLSGVMGTHLDE